MHARASKIMPHMKFTYFFQYKRIYLFKNAHCKNFSAHDEKKLEGTLPARYVVGSITVNQIDCV